MDSRQRLADVTRNRVEMRADILSRRLTADGWFERGGPSDNWHGGDAWKRPLTVSYERLLDGDGDRERLTVWSDGADGIPGTNDDVGCSRVLRHDDAVKAIAAQKARLEANVRAELGRGLLNLTKREDGVPRK